MKVSLALTLIFLVFKNCRGIPSLQEIPLDFGSTDNDIALISKNENSILVTTRLPTSTYPRAYKLEIRPIMDEGTGTGERFTAPGRLTVTLTATALATNEIVLNAVDIVVSRNSISVLDEATQSLLEVRDGIQDTQNEFYTVQLGSQLVPDRNYTLSMEFVSRIQTESNIGMYASTYKAADGSDRYVVSTDFEAPDARMAFPCYDEPQLKATWEVQIIRQEHYHSLANMNLISSVPESGLPGWVRDSYAPSLPMSTYLVCFAVSDYTSQSANPLLYSKPVIIWGPPPMIQRGTGSFSPDFSARVMRFFDEYYGIEYSFPKMDKISIPNFSAGAMENWGLNTYRDTRLLFEEGISTAQDMFSMTNTISHELVHQWWGNLITCNWWDDLWIQEGAATYYAPIGVVGAGLADLSPMETLITSSIQRSFEFDANLAVTHPIHNTGVDPANVPVLFDTLTYHKGASLIRMMNAFVTTNVYNRAMTRFLQRFSYDSPNQWDMFTVLDEAVRETPGLPLPNGVTVTQIMNGWTMQAGYPVVSVERNDFTRQITFTQERFFQRIEDREGDATRWYVPISIFRPNDVQVSVRPETWILQNASSVISAPLSDRWIIVNPRSHGYYRVHYARSLLDPIIAQLLADHTVFDVEIRSQLVDDNLNLAFAGYLDLTKALELTLYLKNERELFPWVSFFNGMALPYRMFARSSSFGHFKNYILSQTADALNAINIEPQPNEPNPTTLLRTRLVEWRCNQGDTACINFARQKFTLWMNNPANTSLVFPDLQPSVYCTAIAQGGDAQWNFVIQQYLVADRDVMQTNLLRALACSRSSFRLNALLDMTINPNSIIRNNQRTTLMQAVAGNSAGVDVAFTFIRNNFATIARRFGVSMVSSVITTLSQHFSSNSEQQDLRTFAQNPAPGHDPIALSAAVQENMRKGSYWMQNHHQVFADYVRGL